MSDDGEGVEASGIALLGEWVVLVHCPRGLPDEVAQAVSIDVERELAGLVGRLSIALAQRYQALLEVHLGE